MDTYEVGDRVKIIVDDLPYEGIIITYDDSGIYKVSVTGLGKVINAVINAEDSDLEPFNLGE